MQRVVAALKKVPVAAPYQPGEKEIDMILKFTGRIIIAAVMAVTLMAVALNADALSFGKYEKIKATGGVVTIPISKLPEGKAKFFKFDGGGREIAFFAVKAADGSYKTAFDACDSCYKSKKGYEQQGDKMNCNNCNQKFAINRLGPNATGGCNPGYLPHQVSGGNILIKAGDLTDGAKYF
jgi:uncharacterized membrane protein